MGGCAVVVAEEDFGLFCERADYGDFDAGGFEGENAVVFQKHHGLVGELACEGAMCGAVEELLVDVVVGHHGGRVEHAELNARGEEADERSIDLALLQVTLLDGFDVGRVVVIVSDFADEVDAFVVHAGLEADGGSFGLAGLVVVAAVDVAHSLAVRIRRSL